MLCSLGCFRRLYTFLYLHTFLENKASLLYKLAKTILISVYYSPSKTVCSCVNT